MRKMLRWLVLMILALTLLPQTAKAQDVVIDKDKGVVIGFDETFAPFGFKNDKGEYVGFDLDLAKEILGRMNVDYKFQPIDWSMKETELNGGSIDMIWNGYSITPERKEVVIFSDPYIENHQVIVVKEDSDIKNKADLAGKTIATQEQSASLEAIMKDKEFVASLAEDPVTYATFVEVFSDLDNGRVDAIVVDETLASYFLEQNKTASDYRFLDDNFGQEDYGVAFRKSDTEFQKEFNKVLKEIEEDGTLEKIKSKWFASVEE